MINGFEKYTHELTEVEHDIVLPLVILGLKNRVGKESAISGNKMCEILNRRPEVTINLTGSRMRKIIHHIRVKRLVKNLIATGSGYYIATDKKELASYIESLGRREEAIASIRRMAEKDYAETDQKTLFDQG